VKLFAIQKTVGAPYEKAILRPAGMALASVNGCGFRGGTKMHKLKVYQETQNETVKP